MEQAKLPALGYTGVLEALAEKFHSSPNFLKKLNADATWKAGDTIKVPNVEPFDVSAKGAPGMPGVEVVVSGATKSLEVRDASGKILMHAPVTTGSEHDPLPIGQWKVNGVSWNPVFNYNPDLFWDANAAQSKAKIPAGPEQSGGHRLDRHQQRPLRPARNARAVHRRPHGISRLHQADELGCRQAGAPRHARHQSDISMTRTYRRSAHVEAVAPWVALSVILLMGWAGAKAVNWARPRFAPLPSASSTRRSGRISQGD